MARLRRAITGLRAASPQPPVLAGFSQGACLSLEHAFSGHAPADALVGFTGCRVGAATDTRPSNLRRGLPVYLRGGDADPRMAVLAFAEAAADLGRQGAALRADIFPDRPHEISLPESAMFMAILSDVSAGRRPEMGAPR